MHWTKVHQDELVRKQFINNFIIDLSCAHFPTVLKEYESSVKEPSAQSTLFEELIKGWAKNPGFFTWKAMALVMHIKDIQYLFKWINANLLELEAPTKILSRKTLETVIESD